MYQEVLQPMGDPPWSRDTPKGLQHVDDLGWRRGEQAKRKEQRKKTVRNKKQQQEDITYQPNLLSCLSPHPRGLQGGSVMGVQSKRRGEWLVWAGGRCVGLQ